MRNGSKILVCLTFIGAVFMGSARSADAKETIISAEQIELALFAKRKSISPVRRRSLNLPSLTFEFNSAWLTGTARRQLDVLGRVLSKRGISAGRFIIAGHTDTIGSAAFNRELSMRRAGAVVAYLVRRHGIAAESVTPVGYGESRLIPNLAPEDPSQRRAEFIRVRD